MVKNCKAHFFCFYRRSDQPMSQSSHVSPNSPASAATVTEATTMQAAAAAAAGAAGSPSLNRDSGGPKSNPPGSPMSVSGVVQLMSALHQNATAVVTSSSHLNGPDQVRIYYFRIYSWGTVGSKFYRRNNTYKTLSLSKKSGVRKTAW